MISFPTACGIEYKVRSCWKGNMILRKRRKKRVLGMQLSARAQGLGSIPSTPKKKEKRRSMVTFSIY
jgi:hypothetical protein